MHVKVELLLGMSIAMAINPTLNVCVGEANKIVNDRAKSIFPLQFCSLQLVNASILLEFGTEQKKNRQICWGHKAKLRMGMKQQQMVSGQ